MAIVSQSVKKTKGVSDIMFVIDKSLSMKKCFEGIRSNILIFINELDGLSSNIINDWQIGLCAYSSSSFDFLDLTRRLDTFSEIIKNIEVKKENEFTPGAIDYTISNSSWREVSNRVIVVFTDEKLSQGKSILYPDGGKFGFKKLLSKIEISKIQMHYFGIHCPVYKMIGQFPNSYYTVVNSFSLIDFSQLMTKLAKTVAVSGINLQHKSQIPEMIYNIQNIKINKQNNN